MVAAVKTKALVPVAMAAGAALGLGSRLVDHTPWHLMWLGNLRAPWLILAMLVGSRARTPRSAVVCGGLSLLAGNLTYYGFKRVVEHGLSAEWFLSVGLTWTLVGVAAGTLCGWAGYRSRSDGPSMSALSAGFLLGEAVALFVATGRAELLLFEGFAALAAFVVSRGPRGVVVISSTTAMFVLTLTSRWTVGLLAATVR
jgi:hypothetical protein